MRFFTKMTTITKDSTKQNLVLMGRRTWDCIPEKFKPLKNRINMVMSTQIRDYGDQVLTCTSILHALEIVSQPLLSSKVETIWVIGGSAVYKVSNVLKYYLPNPLILFVAQVAMELNNFHRLYLTRIYKHFKCDTFFPTIPNNYKLVHDPLVPQGRQKENDIEYEYQIYEKV